MKWWKCFTLLERFVVILDIVLFVSIAILTKNGYFPSIVGVLLISLLTISILLLIGLLFNRK